MLSKYLSVDSAPLPSYFSGVIMDIFQWVSLHLAFLSTRWIQKKGPLILALKCLSCFVKFFP